MSVIRVSASRAALELAFTLASESFLRDDQHTARASAKKEGVFWSVRRTPDRPRLVHLRKLFAARRQPRRNEERHNRATRVSELVHQSETILGTTRDRLQHDVNIKVHRRAS